MFTVLMLWGQLLFAQDLSSLLGKTYNHRDVQSLVNEFNDMEESILPYAKTYKLTSWDHGIEMEFNAYMVLFKIVLYDSGYSYKAYQGQMPHKIEWGWDSTQVQDVTDYLVFNDKNEFVKSYIGTHYFSELYFRDNQLELIKMHADTSLIKQSPAIAAPHLGHRLYPNGKEISGNIIDGHGVMEWKGGFARYEGSWLYGVPHGEGLYTDSAGNQYQGEFKLGFFWGKGIFKSADGGYTYKGDFIMGKQHGKGMIRYSNNITYEGSWYQNSMDGHGTYRLNSENYYVGNMKNDAFNGQGTLFTKDGYIKGSFKDGKPHGYCVQYAKQSDMTLKGNWINGKKEGEFIFISFGEEQKIYFEQDIEVVGKDQEN